MRSWFLFCAASAVWALAGAAVLPEASTGAADVGRPDDVPNRWVDDEDAAPPMGNKYFHESRLGYHYDARFARVKLGAKEKHEALRVLVQTYLATCRQLHVQTWLMHGTLLGWWWGKKIMPWDSDIDVQITEPDMYFLAAYHNMTTYYYRYSLIPEGRTFLLEINPNFVQRIMYDAANVIDARWIDMETGLFIDITAARYAIGHAQGNGMLYEKNMHEYRDTYLYPLLDTTFEGVKAKIPYKYKDMLISEYGKKALTRTEYHDHKFDTHSMEWYPLKEAEEDYERE